MGLHLVAGKVYNFNFTNLIGGKMIKLLIKRHFMTKLSV